MDQITQEWSSPNFEREDFRSEAACKLEGFVEME